MDGLLLDSETVYFINARRCSEIYGYHIPDELILSTMGMNENEQEKQFKAVLGNDFDFRQFLHYEWILHLQYLEEHPMQKKKGVDELFAFLEENGIAKALATSTDRQYALPPLQETGLVVRFNHLVFGDDLKESKPRPEIYLKAIDPFPLSKEQILAFEDSDNGILSACNAGLRVIHIPDLAYVSKETKEKCFAIFSDLTECIPLIEKMNSIQ